MSAKKQTAVQNLIESICKGGIVIINQSVIDLALKEEREQIINAYDGHPIHARNSQNGEEYYELTFGTQSDGTL